MAAVVVIPDVKRLVIDYLRGRDEIKALVSNRVATQLSGKLPLPCLTVIRIGGSPITDPVHWGMGVLVQVDAWDDLGQEDRAWQLASTAQGVMADPNMVGVHSRGVVTGVRLELDLHDLPGAVTQGLPDQRVRQSTARPRVSFDARVFVHPNP